MFQLLKFCLANSMRLEELIICIKYLCQDLISSKSLFYKLEFLATEMTLDNWTKLKTGHVLNSE